MPAHDVGLAIARIGLASQFAATLLLVLLFLLLRHQSRRHSYFAYWTWAWSLLAFALGALFVRFFLLGLSPGGQSEGSLAVRLCDGAYQFGKVGYLSLLLAGVMNYARGGRPVAIIAAGACLALVWGVMTFSLSGVLAQAIRWQVPLAVGAYAACAYVMLTLPKSRRSLGSRVTGMNLVVFALVWLLYLVVFSPMSSGGVRVMGEVISQLALYNAFVDLMLQMLLAFGMVLILHEEARREVESAHAELRAAHQALKAEALRDSLTRALNRRAFTEGAGLGAARASFGTVVVFDLDNLKHINDTHGHQAGDALLKYFVEVMRPNMRPSDKLYRFGGDEFLLVMPRAKRDDVVHRFQRLLTEVPPLQWHQSDGALLELQVSMGAAPYEGGENLEAAVNEADREMYANKRQHKLFNE